MIEPKSLRLGNYISPNQINQIFIKVKTFALMEKWQDLYPIPLTEEILLKAGFEATLLDENNEVEGFYYSLKLSEDKYCDLALLSGDKNGYCEVTLFPYSNQFRYKYVHQLQNIFYSLTNKELEINL